ncbi:hypothetical protein [Desulforegula conservatrix]|uniref:hypothetical protein n=1 Tax=Desulforegula conservatrix TaxID=153026 RepID=UPI000426DB29|nr:hypothetical protein [Desulforegula conservatrix]
MGLETEMVSFFINGDRKTSFYGCPDCWEQGNKNPLYLWDNILRCPVHGEVTNQERISEYQKLGYQFLVGVPPDQEQLS